MSSSTESKPKVKRPGNTAFKQQRLKAWQPILTPKTVIPTFLAIGAIFIPIGIGLYIASDRVNEVLFDYTNCHKATNTFAKPEGVAGPVTEWKYNNATSECTIRFSTDVDFAPPVFMYYRLTNFYQNHRRYVKSFDSNQLLGNYIASASDLNGNCDPIRSVTQSTLDSTGFSGTAVASNAQYYPCGLIANSMFSDEISNLTCVTSSSSFSDGKVCDPASSSNAIFEFKEKGIAWPSDQSKFGQSKWLTQSPQDIPTHLVPPDAWRAAWPEKFQGGYNTTNIPNLQTWERFQVWMRVAGLPNFRKLWGRNDANTLKPATWQLIIKYSKFTLILDFDVARFGGTKSIVISTVSILGGKNPFLGIAYMVVGAVCILLGVVFLARHMIKPRKLGDHSLLSWNQDPVIQRTN